MFKSLKANQIIVGKGGFILGDTSLDLKGTMRYNTKLNILQFSDGKKWFNTIEGDIFNYNKNNISIGKNFS